ncbi:MAG: hypothetical protein HGB02_07375 [Chlorobiaceae bacterium]|nr:hypothetical protein [Chlorobiaceae bacterium]
MSNIEDYRSGRILTGIKMALEMIGNNRTGLTETPDALRIKEKICEFEPVVVSLEEAVAAVRDAGTIAIGERVCRPLHPSSEFTESVFLDELADAMIEAGHAHLANNEVAARVLAAHRGHPLVMSKVSGKYLEICASSRESCVFWKAERKGIRCLLRKEA